MALKQPHQTFIEVIAHGVSVVLVDIGKNLAKGPIIVLGVENDALAAISSIFQAVKHAGFNHSIGNAKFIEFDHDIPLVLLSPNRSEWVHFTRTSRIVNPLL